MLKLAKGSHIFNALTVAFILKQQMRPFSTIMSILHYFAHFACIYDWKTIGPCRSLQVEI